LALPYGYSTHSCYLSILTLQLEKKAAEKSYELMGENTWEFLSFLSGMGFWLILAIILIAVVLYKKFKK
jgi:hypothetical protein